MSLACALFRWPPQPSWQHRSAVGAWSQISGPAGQMWQMGGAFELAGRNKSASLGRNNKATVARIHQAPARDRDKEHEGRASQSGSCGRSAAYALAGPLATCKPINLGRRPAIQIASWLACQVSSSDYVIPLADESCPAYTCFRWSRPARRRLQVNFEPIASSAGRITSGCPLPAAIGSN